MVRCRYGKAFRLYVFFCEFINGLAARYPEIFEGGGTTSQHQINFSKKWRAYATLMELADNDILKVDIVVKEPLEKCLLYLAYRADKNELEGLLHKEAMKNISAGK